jgi:hypothetical protein
MLPVGMINSRTTKAAMLSKNAQARINANTTAARTGWSSSPVSSVRPRVRPSWDSTFPSTLTMTMPTRIERGQPIGAPSIRRAKKATTAAVTSRLRKLMSSSIGTDVSGLPYSWAASISKTVQDSGAKVAVNRPSAKACASNGRSITASCTTPLLV